MIAPRLEYDVALDAAAALLGGFGAGASPFLAVLTSPTFVDAVLSRAEGPVHLAVPSHMGPHAAGRLAGGVVPPALAEGSRLVPLGAAAGCVYERVLWATPRPETWEETLRRVGAAAPPGALLAVLTGTTLGDSLRTGRRAVGEGEPCALAQPLALRLKRSGWRLLRARPLGSATSAGWAVAARIAARAGRPDLADRAELAHHLAVESPVAAAYVLLLAARTGVTAA